MVLDYLGIDELPRLARGFDGEVSPTEECRSQQQPSDAEELEQKSACEVTADEMWERTYGGGGSKRPNVGRLRTWLSSKSEQMSNAARRQVGAGLKALAVIASWLFSPHSAGWESWS